MDPLMDGDVLGQYLAVDDKRRHLVIRVYLQVLGREILPLAKIERRPRNGACFGQRDIGHERCDLETARASDCCAVQASRSNIGIFINQKDD